MNGPYSGSTTSAWNYQQALFIAGGIGVTPFASLLQSVMKRYRNAMSTCPHCSHMSCSNLPASMGKLKHVFSSSIAIQNDILIPFLKVNL